MKKSLYHIESEYLELMHSIEQAEGEVSPEQAEQLTINEQEREGKSVAYVCVIKEKEAEVAMIDEEIKRLTAIKKQHKGLIERLQMNLLNAVNLFGEYTAGMFTITTRKSTSVNIEDESQIPVEYLNSKIVQSYDKAAIKEAIKAGATVDGASININLNLRIK